MKKNNYVLNIDYDTYLDVCNIVVVH